MEGFRIGNAKAEERADARTSGTPVSTQKLTASPWGPVGIHSDAISEMWVMHALLDSLSWDPQL